MARIVLMPGTTEGQTGRIAVFLGRGDPALRYGNRHLRPDAIGLHRLQDYDGVIVGASIHMGRHERYVTDYVRRNRAVIDRRPSAFFSVSLAAQGDMGRRDALR